MAGSLKSRSPRERETARPVLVPRAVLMMRQQRCSSTRPPQPSTRARSRSSPGLWSACPNRTLYPGPSQTPRPQQLRSACPTRTLHPGPSQTPRIQQLRSACPTRALRIVLQFPKAEWELSFRLGIRLPGSRAFPETKTSAALSPTEVVTMHNPPPQSASFCRLELLVHLCRFPLSVCAGFANSILVSQPPASTIVRMMHSMVESDARLVIIVCCVGHSSKRVGQTFRERYCHSAS